ncbi:MAG: NTP transferase domain-containing protein [Planctomycetota bacterium]|jgi:bifunctional UDP-N-acetylglucosamine pyrophosphorylase/glucosamine-1-phosphate N-acetyltransferase
MAETVAIILAAGVSTRMNTQLAKVLHEVCGRPMLAYVLNACRKVGIAKMYVVVGNRMSNWEPLTRSCAARSTSRILTARR